MIAFYLLVGIMPLVRHSLWSENVIAGLTLTKCLGMICLFVALLHLGQRHIPPRFFVTLQSKLFVVFGLATMASFTFFGPSTVALEVSPFSNWTSFLLLFFVATVLVDSLEKLRFVLLSLVGGVAFASAHLLREWIGFGGTVGSRPGWVTGDPNYFALSALLCMPLSLMLALERRPMWERLFCWGCLAVTLLAFTLAGSRGGFLGLVVAFAAIAWHSPYRRRMLTVGTVALAALLLFAPTSPLARLLEPSHGDIQSTDVREALFWAGLAMFEQNPWTGIGVGNFKSLIGAYALGDEALVNVAHNTYLEVGAEMGVFGLAAFVTVLLASIRTLRKLRLRTRHGQAPLFYSAAHGLEAGLLGAMVAIFFLSALHVRMMWFIVILSMCLPELAASISGRLKEPTEARRAVKVTIT